MDGSSEEGRPPEPTLELANDVIRERLESQKVAIERVETKVSVLLGFAAVALQFAATHSSGVLLGLATGFYALTFLAGLVGIALYEHEFPPDPGRLVQAYLDRPRAHVLDVLVRTRAEAFYANTRHAKVKRTAWFATMGFLSVAVILSALAVWRTPDG